MFFHIRMTDYPVSRRKPDVREKHFQYLDSQTDIIVARGPTQDDDGKVMRSGVFFIDVPDRAAAEKFVADEPHYQSGAFMNVEILRWNNMLGRKQRDFARKDDPVCWYIRTYAKPGAHVQRNILMNEHKAYLEPNDAERFIIRGGLSTDDGAWLGFASLIALPDRSTADKFAAEEPFCKNGLFYSVLIERYKLGGRPGQVT